METTRTHKSDLLNVIASFVLSAINPDNQSINPKIYLLPSTAPLIRLTRSQKENEDGTWQEYYKLVAQSRLFYI